MTHSILIVSSSLTVRSAWQKVLSVLLPKASLNIQTYPSVSADDFPPFDPCAYTRIFFGTPGDERREYAAVRLWSSGMISPGCDRHTTLQDLASLCTSRSL